MRTYFLLIPILLAAVPATSAAQQGPRRGPAVPALAVREAAEARPSLVRQPTAVRTARAAVDAVAAPRPKRPRGG